MIPISNFPNINKQMYTIIKSSKKVQNTEASSKVFNF